MIERKESRRKDKKYKRENRREKKEKNILNERKRNSSIRGKKT